MTHLFPVRLLPAGTAIGSATVVETSAIDLTLVERLEGLGITLASPGDADISVDYAISFDGVTWSGWTQLDASTNTTFASTPTGLNVEPLPSPLAPYVKFRLTGVGSNNAGTTVAVVLLLRETLTAAAA